MKNVPWKKPKPALREVQLQKLKALLNQIGWSIVVPKSAVEGGEVLGAVVGTRLFCAAATAALEEPNEPKEGLGSEATPDATKERP